MPEIKGEKTELPKWPKIIFLFLISFLVFLVSNWVFIETLSDIKEYTEDHSISYNYLEFLAIILFLIAFYFVPAFILSAFKRFLPLKIRTISNSERIYFIFSLISVIFFSIIILWVVFPALATTKGPERDGLWYIVLGWLGSIFLINILLSHSLFEGYCEKIIEKTGCHEKLASFCKRFSGEPK